jgi:hypothetical protein
MHGYAHQTVRGTVTDPLGAVVGGAKVTLQGGYISAETTTTDDKGYILVFSGG